MTPRIRPSVRYPLHEELSSSNDENALNYQHADVRNENMLKLLLGHKIQKVKSECKLFPEEKAVVRVFKAVEEKKSKSVPNHIAISRKRAKYNDDDDDNDTVSTIGFKEAKYVKKIFMEEQCFLIKNIEIISVMKKTILLRTTQGSKVEEHSVAFESVSEALSFSSFMEAFQEQQ